MIGRGGQGVSADSCLPTPMTKCSGEAHLDQRPVRGGEGRRGIPGCYIAAEQLDRYLQLAALRFWEHARSAPRYPVAAHHLITRLVSLSRPGFHPDISSPVRSNRRRVKPNDKPASGHPIPCACNRCVSRGPFLSNYTGAIATFVSRAGLSADSTCKLIGSDLPLPGVFMIGGHHRSRCAFGARVNGSAVLLAGCVPLSWLTRLQLAYLIYIYSSARPVRV